MNSMYLRIKREGQEVFRPTLAGWVRVPPGELQRCAPSGGVTVGVVGGAVVATRSDRAGPLYTVALLEEGRLYKLGPRFGFLVKLPEEETDPVLRVAREIGIPSAAILDPVPAGEAMAVEPLAEVETDGRREGDKVRDFTYVIQTFTKPMRAGGYGRFVSRVGRTERLGAESFREACSGLDLSHRPEWLVVEAGAAQ